MGEWCSVIVKHLVMHGRLTLAEIYENIKAEMSQGDEDVEPSHATDKGNNGREDSTRNYVEDAFLTLLDWRLIERAPPCPLLKRVRGDNEEQATTKSRVSAELGPEQSSELDQVARDEWLRYQNERFVPPPGMNNVQRGVKRSREQSDEPGETKPRADITSQSNSSQEIVLWRVNMDEFARRFRHSAIMFQAEIMFGEEAGAVMQTMLKLTGPFEQRVKEPMSKAIERRQLINGMMEDFDVDNEEKVVEALDELVSQSEGTIICQKDGDTVRYIVNMQQMIQARQEKLLEAHVRDKFGQNALRIFRLLKIKGPLEQKIIAEMCMLKYKDTRERLYSLFRAGYIQLRVNRFSSFWFFTFRGLHALSVTASATGDIKKQ